jgi:hypothetical protein
MAIDNFIIKMLNYRLQPRLGMTAVEGNILMTQIRAEKKNYALPNPVTHTNSCQQPTGKKIFKDILYRPTLSPSRKENGTTNLSYFIGKRILG